MNAQICERDVRKLRIHQGQIAMGKILVLCSKYVHVEIRRLGQYKPENRHSSEPCEGAHHTHHVDSKLNVCRPIREREQPNNECHRYLPGVQPTQVHTLLHVHMIPTMSVCGRVTRKLADRRADCTGTIYRDHKLAVSDAQPDLQDIDLGSAAHKVKEEGGSRLPLDFLQGFSDDF